MCYNAIIIHKQIQTNNIIEFRVLLTNVFRVFLKKIQLRNYFLKKFNISISDILNVQFFIKIHYLKFLKSAFRTLINILFDGESELKTRS